MESGLAGDEFRIAKGGSEEGEGTAGRREGKWKSTKKSRRGTFYLCSLRTVPLVRTRCASMKRAEWREIWGRRWGRSGVLKRSVKSRGKGSSMSRMAKRIARAFLVRHKF